MREEGPGWEGPARSHWDTEPVAGLVGRLPSCRSTCPSAHTSGPRGRRVRVAVCRRTAQYAMWRQMGQHEWGTGTPVCTVGAPCLAPRAGGTGREGGLGVRWPAESRRVLGPLLGWGLG